jgi:hypothetical protein
MNRSYLFSSILPIVSLHNTIGFRDESVLYKINVSSICNINESNCRWSYNITNGKYVAILDYYGNHSDPTFIISQTQSSNLIGIKENSENYI